MISFTDGAALLLVKTCLDAQKRGARRQRTQTTQRTQRTQRTKDTQGRSTEEGGNGTNWGKPKHEVEGHVLLERLRLVQEY